jgi:hypothetical protein
MLSLARVGLATILVGLALLLFLLAENRDAEEWCGACAWINCLHVADWCSEETLNNAV